MMDIEGFDSWWDLERARVQLGRHTTKEACLLAWQAATEQQQSVIAELVGRLEDCNCILKGEGVYPNSVNLNNEIIDKVKGVKSE